METSTKHGRETRKENMSSTLIKEPPITGPAPEDLKLGAAAQPQGRPV